MKKLLLVVCITFFCLLAAFSQTAVIRELSGTVELKQAGQTAFVSAKIGDEIAQNTIVSTGFKSSALIEAGSTLLTIRPLTRLSLAEISRGAGTETVNVALQTGRIRVDVNPPLATRTSMTVRGPSATASVRGTSFEFDTKNLYVNSGVVAFQGGKGVTMLVSRGSSSTLNEDGTAVDPIETIALELVPKTVTAADLGLNNNSPSNSLSNSPSDPSNDSSVEFTASLGFN